MTETNPTADLPPVLVERLRAHGGSEEEIQRLRDEHEGLDYYQRFVANQQGGSYDDASVQALLEVSRERWRSGQRSAFVDGAAGAPEDQPGTETVATASGEDVRTGRADPVHGEGTQTPGSAGVAGPSARPVPAPSTHGTSQATVADQTVEQPQAGAGSVPSGTAQEVLDWVGNDPARAQAALEAERASDDPRTSLVPKLERVADRGGR